MTDYGPGHGSPPWQPEPWHPDDPLYGEQGWDAGRQGGGGWDPYAEGGEYSTGQYPTGQYPQFPHQQQYPQQQPYGGPGEGWETGQLPTHEPQQTYGWHVQSPQPGTGYDTGQFPAQGFYPDQAYGNGGYGGGDPGTGPIDMYGGQQQAYYPGDTGTHPVQQIQQPVPQQAPLRPSPPPQRKPPEQEQSGEWNPFDEDDDGPETHPFFTRGSDADDTDDEYERRRPRVADDDDDDDGYRDTRRRPAKDGKRGGTKRRGGCACLAAVVALAGVVTGGGYAGYQYYENHYAPPPDYAGQGGGTVQVQIPDSATLAQIGNILKQDGVVESVDAFTKAAAVNPKGASIQGGIYSLHMRMSAASAVTLMLDPAAQSALIIPEGWRASQVYQALDSRLGVKPGTTAHDAATAKLGLPSYDKNGTPEGFLYPSRYAAARGGDPVAILRQMVRQAQAEYAQDDLTAEAAKVGKTPYQIIVIASLIQAEAQEPHDFGKVSRVIYNRLDQDMALGFDSTINYAKGRSTLHTTTADTQFDSPYNTYLHKGLPPGPIDNPGHEAIEAALHPTPGDWLYFVTVQPGDTRFTASAAQHERNVAAFNKYQQEHGG